MIRYKKYNERRKKMIKKFDELTLEEINKMEFLEEEDLKKLSFAELCIYMENLNKINERVQKIKENKGE